METAEDKRQAAIDRVIGLYELGGIPIDMAEIESAVDMADCRSEAIEAAYLLTSQADCDTDRAPRNVIGALSDSREPYSWDGSGD